MSGTYKAIGINLKSTPMGESDRLLTILTEEYGLLRAVAPGSRKHKSSLGGRSSLFVVNQLLIAKGRNLDKIIQAESLASYPGLSQDLRKLTASQYLAELALFQALSDQPQTELFCLVRQNLDHLEALPSALTLACLTHATFHLLAVAGLAPQVLACSVTQQPVVPNFGDPNWRIGFSAVAGGVVNLSGKSLEQMPELLVKLTAAELNVLQRLPEPTLIQDLLSAQEFLVTDTLSTQSTKSIDTLPSLSTHPNHQVWLSIERILRRYAQYHFDRPIRSATLIDTCFTSNSTPFLLQTS